MKVSYNSARKPISSEVKDMGFYLSNRKGGFACFGMDSKYRGLFLPVKGRLLKILDFFESEGSVTELMYTPKEVIQKREGYEERFSMPEGVDALVYSRDASKPVSLLFDVKHPYDQREWGRNYQATKKGKYVILTFRKVTDAREDSSSGNEEYSLVVVVQAGEDASIRDQWVEQQYGFDIQRKSYPTSRYVYRALESSSSRIIIAAGATEQEAIEACEKADRSGKGGFLDRFRPLPFEGEMSLHVSIATHAAIQSLDGLTSDAGIYAGVPWFFQSWSRDSLVSLKALFLEKRFAYAKEILMRYLGQVQNDGTLLSKEGGMPSADALGWLSLRLEEWISVIKEGRLESRFLRQSEQAQIIELLEQAVNRLFQSHTHHQFATCGNKETWMDSEPFAMGRLGICVEIQAQRLQMYDFLFRVTGKKIYADLRQKLQSRAKISLWTGSYLRDGVGDDTIRPNVFLAAYHYPDLLTGKEWETCFDTILPKLWLPWGGLSTIDISDQRFSGVHTGENATSYHHGDSWYWINNLAAIVLNRLNSEKYKSYVDAILASSTHDILWQGFAGAHSELSSALEQKPGGCFNQAWSNALYIELVHELANKRRNKNF